ncbi:LacI family DNA-binding transcriptional regulator [Cypionkella sp.]|uniref:LacI family DNA-binding transcriptional regulator n=1 Tax=Cypionkella sp. TaxID=2811411 RepID=UPI00271E23C8|nr:LacI family DNA-binding transcriptional regulator [Cypionkella sp.]MDO8984334.1 LacI family DNA-binding transcriptional regulator [Cypionkella sp.]MDP2048008.1 LacI family DNA-binding transcriptional regulator [Cypionkella sp.]
MTESPLPLVGAERPTLKTIAAATGLAIATVSRALKDAPDIGEETKRRVRETALKLGYRQNRAAVRLRTGKTNVIALLLSTESDVMNHTSKLLYSIADALRGTAYHLVVMPFFRDQDPMDPVRYIVETESADGIILNQTKPDDPRIRYMTEHHIPFATHGRTDMGLDHPYFDYDNEAFGHLAVQALAERQRRHVYMIAPPRNHMYARHMIMGASQEATARNMRFELADTVTSDSSADDIEAAVAQRFSDAAPDAIIAGSTTGAIAAVAGVESAGLQIGKNLDVVSKEAIRLLHRFRKEMIVVNEDVARAGNFLARAVMAAIEGRAPDQGQALEVPQASDFRTGN